MTEHDIIGHEGVRRVLRGIAAMEEPPHALLFAGPARTGRTLLALELASLLNCDHPDPSPDAGEAAGPCNECRACHLIAERRHPDVLHLEPGDSFCRGGGGHQPHPNSRDIRICQVRGLIESVSRYPFEGRYRVIIIEPADRMGLEAANTLLKTLEEPPPATILALITAAPESLLETIRSRCRTLTVSLVADDIIAEGLRERGFVPEIAERATAESRRRPADALAFAEQPDLMDDRSRLLQRCAEIAGARATERMVYAGDLAERWRRERELVLTELDIWETYWEGLLRERAADVPPPGADDVAGVRPVVEALQAVAEARRDLEAQVIARMALELMLLRFPTATLAAEGDTDPSQSGNEGESEGEQQP